MTDQRTVTTGPEQRSSDRASEALDFGASPSLEEFLGPSVPSPGEEQDALSRRQFLRGSLAGGALGLAAAAGTGVAVWQVADAQAQAALTSAEAEIARLRGLVDRYEALEKVGLDGILHTGMAAVVLPLKGVEEGAAALKRGLERVEEGLLAAQQALPTGHEAIAWLEDRITGLASGISRLEEAVSSFLEGAGETRVGEAVRTAADWILDHLPFGLGDGIRALLDGLVDLVTGIDDLVAGINAAVLEPLRASWFPAQEDEGVGATLLDSLVTGLLDPLEAHLARLASLSDAWQAKLLAPAESALEERARIRDDISRYRADIGLD